jgi:RNA polymerase sigma-70 factor, ECF subfamily
LLRLATAYVRDGAAAQDVVQDTWLGVLRGLDRFEGRSPPKVWIFQILVNTAKT